MAEKIAWVKGLTAAAGREVRFGIRLHVITRDSSEAAWAEAKRQLDAIDPAAVERVQASLARSESEGQKRMVALHGGNRDNLEVYPNLWAGVGLVRGGAGTALVGSHQEVADRIEEYSRLGITEYVMSGHPHVEEAYWFGEGVLPLLRKRGLWEHPESPHASDAVYIPFAGAGARGPDQTADGQTADGGAPDRISAAAR